MKATIFIQKKIRLIIILFLLVIVIVKVPNSVQEEKSNEKRSSIQTMLNVAFEPIGSTMYVWGGGWDGEDTKSGASSTQIGLSPKWAEFTKLQDENYDFKDHRYERENGLDCSGYVGWVLYNTFEKENGKNGYVTSSTEMAESLAKRGWGQLIYNSQRFLPGDIVSMEGHVWICLGTCKDGSVLLIHSSPPGVSVCGTPSPQKEENQKSMAVKLATEYMEKQQSNWQEKYPNREVPYSYLENVSVFRWSRKIMQDAEKMQKLSAEEIIVYMSPDI